MSAVSQATVPFYQQALAYWSDLRLQCQKQVEAINSVVEENNLSQWEKVQWRPGSMSFAMLCTSLPSTVITLSLDFEHWGPKVTGCIRGEQEDSLHFYPEDFEFPITFDDDDSVVAVIHEGRSLTPLEFAKFVVQNFRRSYPGISLPCPDAPLK